jgi:threonine/homoserine/homoserine lactone efflux protein
MTFESSISFVFAFAIVVAIPGPGVIAVVSEALAKGAKQGWFTVFGIIAGDFIYLSLAMFGMGLIAQVMGEAFFIIKLVAGIYLVYLGLSLWRSKGSFSFDGRRADPRGSFIAGFLITLANPKAITFYCVFLPNFMNLTQFSLRDYALVSVLDISVLMSIMAIYIYLAVATGRLAGNHSGVFLRRVAGVIMAGTGATVTLN